MSKSVRRKYIRSVVQGILKDLHVDSAPVRVDKIIEKFNIEVLYQSGADNLSGFLLRDKNEGRVIIGVNNNHSAARRKFTLAHELGHFLLHEAEEIHVDDDKEKKNLLINRRDDDAALGIYVKEREANLFAAELLMPEFLIQKELKEQGQNIHLLNDDELSPIAKKLEVSVQALTYRLSNLGYIWAW